VTLTSAGVDEYERAQQGPTEHLAHIDHQGVVVVASPGAVVHSPGAAPVVIDSGIQVDEVNAWIGMYRGSLEQSARLADAESLLSELQLAGEQGDVTAMRRLVPMLLSIAEGAAGSAVYEGLVAAARHLGLL
jgi:hypothetical protein